MKTRTLYDVLQIAPNAAPPIVDAAYKHLRAHFDLSDDRAAGRLVDDAYATLRNADARLAYDAKLAALARESEATTMTLLPRGRSLKCRLALAGWSLAAAAIGFGTATAWHLGISNPGAHASTGTALVARPSGHPEPGAATR